MLPKWFDDFLKVLREGELSVDDIGRGMHKAYLNAGALIRDANVLLPSSPGRAISLGVLAIEELGKVFLLAEAVPAAAGGKVTWTTIQRNLRLKSHDAKQRIFAEYGAVLLDSTAKAVGKERFYDTELSSGLSPLLDLFKQMGFYVEAYNGQFLSPDQFGADNLQWAEYIIEAAQERFDSLESMHGSEERSIASARILASLGPQVAKAKDIADLKRILDEHRKTRG